MRTPPSSGWIEPVLLYLTVVEAMRLERTSKAWRRWLETAEDVWRSLATSCGVCISIGGPLSPYLEVSSWRRLCCELTGRISRELCALESRSDSAIRTEGYEAGTIVELSDGSFGEIVRPLRSGWRNGGLLEEYTVLTPGGGIRTVAASAAKYAPAPRSPRWWHAVASLEIEDQAALDFCCGIAFRYWRAESGGVFTFAAPRSTPVHYRRRKPGGWNWSPDRVNWMPCTEMSPDGARWRAHSLADANRQIAHFLDRHDPCPPDFCLRETTAEVVLANPAALSASRRRDDDRAARSARQALAPDAHGGVLALANTHVHVVHAPFQRATNLLHLEPWTIAGHPGGWIHSTDGGSTWNIGHQGLLDTPRHQQQPQDQHRPLV